VTTEESDINNIAAQLAKVIKDNGLHLEVINIKLDSRHNTYDPFYLSELTFEIKTMIMRK